MDGNKEVESRNLCLTPSELVDLTDYKQRKKQKEALVKMGYPFEISPRGRIKVLRSAVERTPKRVQRREEPDLDGI